MVGARSAVGPGLAVGSHNSSHLASHKRPVPSVSLFIFACKHDVNWLKALLPHELPAVHVAGCPSDESDGCYDEAVGYLQFIVRNYDALPKRLLFLHGHETSFHYDLPVPRAVERLVTTPYFSESSFGGVYCQTNAGMATEWYTRSRHVDPSVLWNHVFAGTGIALPSHWSYPCCGTFFVNRTAIHQHSRHVYETILSNLRQRMPEGLRKGVCGRVLESAWATLFLPPRTNYSEPPYCATERCCVGSPERCPRGPCPGSRQQEAHTSRALLGYVLLASFALYCIACLAHSRRRGALVRGVRAGVRIALSDE